MVKIYNQNYMLVASSLYFALLAKDPLSNRDISCTQTLSIEFSRRGLLSSVKKVMNISKRNN